MSYDVYLAIDTGGEELTSVGESFNYTYNCAPMFCKAFKEKEIGLNVLHNKLAKEAALLLRNAIIYMQDHPKEMNKLNPSNGWGHYDTALEFLEGILTECLKHPKATVRIC